MINPGPISGVYAIESATDRKVYVGSSRHIVSRVKSHMSALNKGTHHNKKLQEAWNRLGPNDFTAKIVRVFGDLAAMTRCEQEIINMQDKNLLYNYAVTTSTKKRKPPLSKKLNRSQDALLITPDYYTVEEFASRHGVSLRTAYDWVRDERVPSFREHGMVWVLKSDAEAFTPPRGRYQKGCR